MISKIFRKQIANGYIKIYRAIDDSGQEIGAWASLGHVKQALGDHFQYCTIEEITLAVTNVKQVSNV